MEPSSIVEETGWEDPVVVPIVELVGVRRAYCSHYKCRVSEVDILPKKMSRCSKCKEARYCSRECQKRHWPVHKVNCKEIAKLRDICLEEGPIECLMGDVKHSVQADGSPGWTHVASHKERLADMIFLEGYHSSDTMDRAGTIYSSAVSHYADLRHKGCYSSVEVIKPAIILVALDRDDMAFTVLLERLRLCGVLVPESPCFRQGDWILPLRKCSESLPESAFDAHGKAGNFVEVLQHIILLLVKLRVISYGRMELFEKTDAGDHLKSVLPVVAEFVRGDKAFLRRQRNDIHRLLATPGVRMAATKLRDCILLSTNVSEEERWRSHLPDEFFHLIQDCYFLSPGVNDLLIELVPEAEED